MTVQPRATAAVHPAYPSQRPPPQAQTARPVSTLAAPTSFVTGIDSSAAATPAPNTSRWSGGLALPSVGSWLSGVHEGLKSGWAKAELAYRGLEAAAWPAAMVVLPRAAAPTPTRPLNLNRSSYPDAVGLYELLGQLTRAEQDDIARRLAQATGLPFLWSHVVEAVALRPDALGELGHRTPSQLDAALGSVQGGHQAGLVPDAGPRKRVLPNPFDLSQFSTAVVPRPTAEMITLIPGRLYYDDVPSARTDEAVRPSVVLAELLDRLAANAGRPASEAAFVVVYRGTQYESVASLLHALQHSGHRVTAEIKVRAANVTSLHTPAPAPSTTVPDGAPATAAAQYRDVPAALLLETGIEGTAVPGLHSELVLHVDGPEVRGDVRWFQGMFGIGFSPEGVFEVPPWCGFVTTDRFEGADALDAAAMAELLQNAISATARQNHWMWDGYGPLGLCSDSVALVSQALAGHAVGFPLLLHHDKLRPQLESLCTGSTAALAKRLLSAIDTVPCDATADVTMPAVREERIERLRRSMPWKPETSPFACVDKVLTTLT